MALTLPPIPFKDAAVERDGKLTRSFISFLLPFLARVNAAATALVSVALTAQSAAIPTTALIPLPASGRYRVSVHARVTTAAGTSSSLIPTISYTSDGIACTQSGAALTSNDVTQPASWIFLVKADASTPISYATSYTSAGVPALVHDLDLIVEGVG